MFSSGILDWDLDSSFTKSFQMDNISSSFVHWYFVVLKNVEYFWIDIKSETCIISLYSINWCLEKSNSNAKLIFKSQIIIF